MEEKPIILITGCSSGIGYQLVKLLAERDYRIVATTLPRSIEKLREDESLKGERIWIRELDVTDYDKGTQIVRETESKWGPIDILVNNAGISFRSAVEDMSPEDEQFQMQVNFLGPMHLVRECLPAMRKRGSGRIINISSVGGMMAMPTMASYSASKFALEGATESLWYELKPWNIKVTLVRPGFVRSKGFTKVLYSKRKRTGQSDEAYSAHYENMTSFVEKLMRRASSTSEDVAKRILKILKMENPPLRAAGTTDACLFYFVRRALPRWLYHKLLYRSLPGIKKWGK